MINQFFNRFLARHQAHIVENMAPKTHVKQVRNGVIATDIHIDWRPVANFIWAPSTLGVMRIGVAKQVPAATGVAVHRVGLTLSWFTASRTSGIYPVSLS